jgi:hypothetical protein
MGSLSISVFIHSHSHGDMAMQPYPRDVATRLEGEISLPEHIWSGIRECSHQYCNRGCNSGYTFTNTEKIADETKEEDFAVCIVWRGSTVSSSTA